MDKPLLKTKLYVPPLRPKPVSRPRLIERLKTGLQLKLTLVAAPVGYGKTTLLSEGVRSSQMPVGWLGDKVDKRWISAGALAMMGLGLLCFEYVFTVGVWVLVPFLVLFGTGFGGNHVMRAAMSREYFGRSKFSTIFGFLMGVVMLGQIIGTPLAGWVFDNWGSYQGIWLAFAMLAIVALIAIATTPIVRLGNQGH